MGAILSCNMVLTTTKIQSLTAQDTTIFSSIIVVINIGLQSYKPEQHNIYLHFLKTLTLHTNSSSSISLRRQVSHLYKLHFSRFQASGLGFRTGLMRLCLNQWRTQEFFFLGGGGVQQIQLRTERTRIWGW